MNFTQTNVIERNSQEQFVFWLTGLSGAGKTTIGKHLSAKLKQLKYCVVFLDGDEIRHGLSHDLGFSQEDRAENVRRVAEISKMIAMSGVIVVVALITPLRVHRAKARKLLDEVHFVETFVDAPFEVCEQRDPKGLYSKARRGEVRQFTGLNSLYEKPISPELQIDTVGLNVEESVDQILGYLHSKTSISNLN